MSHDRETPPDPTLHVLELAGGFLVSQAITILKHCRAAMAEGGKVLMVEVVVSPERTSRFAEILDLQMQLFTSGRERAADEHRWLYEQAGLRMTRIVPTTSFMQVVEGVAA